MKLSTMQRVIIFLSVLFCSLQAVIAQPYTRKGFTEEGQASYYANQFHGRKTASGEKFNMYAMTAAHKNIPFNSIIKVTNQKNGKWVTLRVNDRGPFSPNRVVDVSKAAALKLDMVNDGLANVKIELLRVGGDAVNPEEDQVAKVVDKQEEKKEKQERVKKEKTSEKKQSTTIAKNQKEKKTPKPKGKADKKRPPQAYKTVEELILPVGTYSVYGYKRYPKGYGAQIGTYNDVNSAVELGKEAIKAGLDKIYVQAGWQNDEQVFRVLFGEDLSAEQARELVKEAISKGYPGAFKRKHF